MSLCKNSMTVWALFFSALLNAGCAATSGGFAGLGGKKQKSPSATGSVSATADAAQANENLAGNGVDINSLAVLEDIAATSTQEYLTAALENASNDSFSIGDHIISDVKDMLTLYESELMDLADKYPTLGDFIDSRSGDRYAPIDIDGVAQGLALAEAFVTSGTLDEASLPSESEQNNGTNAESDADQAAGFFLQQLDKGAAREAKLFALTVAAFTVGSQSGLYLGNYDHPSGNVTEACMIGEGPRSGFMTFDWKLDEGCVCQHYPHGCKVAEEAGKPKYCTGAPTPNDVGYDKDCPVPAAQ